MSNVVGIAGKIPVPDRRIADMQPGQIGYTVEWAYDSETGELDETFTLDSKGGTCSLRVECVRPHQYSLTFETPVYSNR